VVVEGLIVERLAHCFRQFPQFCEESFSHQVAACRVLLDHLRDTIERGSLDERRNQLGMRLRVAGTESSVYPGKWTAATNIAVLYRGRV